MAESFIPLQLPRIAGLPIAGSDGQVVQNSITGQPYYYSGVLNQWVLMSGGTGGADAAARALAYYMGAGA